MKLYVVDPNTGVELPDVVVQADLKASALLCSQMMTVWDVDDEAEVQIPAKEKDQSYTGPGSRYIHKTYIKYCDFDVVQETGEVVGEGRYLNVTTKL
jgi:hypothetical protein